MHSRPSTTNATGTRLSSKAVNSLSHQNPRQRGNVWDRLGKPCAGNCDVMDEKNYMLGIDIVKRMKMENGGEGLDNDRLTWVVPGGGASIKSMEEIDELDNGYHKVITSTHADDPRGREHGINQTGMHHDAGDSRRKRQFGEICPGNGSVSLSHGRDKHLQNEAAFQELQRLTSVKFSRSQRLDGVTTKTRSSDGLFSGAMPHSHRSPNTVLNPGAYKVSQPQLNREVLATTTTQKLPSLNSSLLAKSESLNNAESGCSNYRPMKAEVVDVKLRLQQIEMEMCKLRTKQAGMNNDAKVNILSHCGEQNRSEEDIESRTVFVSNVHFAATKEAISSHFTKCGAVVKVILLTDKVTAQPKGSAYVVFASKESTNKAVALSGTSFFSRTLKVVRKGDLPAGISGLAQLAGKPVQSWLPPSNRKGWSIQRPYSSSHRQWRRDLPATAGNLFSAPAGGMVADAAAEQEGVDSGCQQHLATRSLTYVRSETGSSKETHALA